MKIAFLIGDTGISGGTNVILQHALYLKQNHHDVTIYYIFSSNSCWHEAFNYLTFKHINSYDGEYFDIAIATWWATVYELERINSSKKCYFVQSIESFFVQDTDIVLKNQIDSTYEVNLPVITEASWIANYMKKKYGATTQLVRNGIRKDYFYSDAPLITKRRILVEGPVDCDFKNVPRTIYLCRKYTDWEIWLLTSSRIKSFPGVARVFSNIPAKDTGDIYRKCDFIVKLSYVEGMFGPPLEMFHCGGTAIVYDVTGFDEYIEDGKNASVVSTGNEKELINNLCRITHDIDFLNALKSNALSTAEAWPDWDSSSREFENALLGITETPLSFDKLQRGQPSKKRLIKPFLPINFLRKAKNSFSLYFLSPYIYPFMTKRGQRTKDV